TGTGSATMSTSKQWAAILLALKGCSSPSITTNPSGQTVTYGAASVSFTAAASGFPTPTVQWQVNTGSGFSNIGGATSATYTINKANATVVVTPYTCPSTTYTGLPHTATITSITGVNGETGATVGTVDVSNTTHTAVGTYSSDTWSFTGTANYNNIAATTITDCIAKANATWTTTPNSKTYTNHDRSPATR